MLSLALRNGEASEIRESFGGLFLDSALVLFFFPPFKMYDFCTSIWLTDFHFNSFLDWKARADVVKLLKDLKKELTLLVVSHDLK